MLLNILGHKSMKRSAPEKSEYILENSDFSPLLPYQEYIVPWENTFKAHFPALVARKKIDKLHAPFALFLDLFNPCYAQLPALVSLLYATEQGDLQALHTSKLPYAIQETLFFITALYGQMSAFDYIDNAQRIDCLKVLLLEENGFDTADRLFKNMHYHAEIEYHKTLIQHFAHMGRLKPCQLLLQRNILPVKDIQRLQISIEQSIMNKDFSDMPQAQCEDFLGIVTQYLADAEKHDTTVLIHAFSQLNLRPKNKTQRAEENIIPEEKNSKKIKF